MKLPEKITRAMITQAQTDEYKAQVQFIETLSPGDLNKWLTAVQYEANLKLEYIKRMKAQIAKV